MFHIFFIFQYRVNNVESKNITSNVFNGTKGTSPYNIENHFCFNFCDDTYLQSQIFQEIMKCPFVTALVDKADDKFVKLFDSDKFVKTVFIVLSTSILDIILDCMK